MSSPILKGRISVLSQNSGADKSLDLAGTTSWMDKSYQHKPAYIAKKIPNEEVLSDPFKPGFCDLLQIKEKNDESEDAEAAETLREPTGGRNIFRVDNTLASSKYKEHGKGPQINGIGKVVRHTIVGNPEIFERHQRGARRHISLRDSLFSNDPNDSSAMSRAYRRMSTMIGEGSPTFTRMASHANVMKKTMIIERREKHHQQKDLRVNSETLYKKIEEMRQNQKRVEEMEAKVDTRLVFADQLKQTKDERNIKKYDAAVVDWDNVIDKMNKKVHRKHGNSVMERAEAHREKKEMVEAIGLAQTDQERLGKTYWKDSLRNNGIPDRVNHNKSIPTLEIIKKSSKITHTRSNTTLPSIADIKTVMLQSTSSSDFKFLDRTKKEYILTKTLLLEERLKQIRPQSIDLGDFLVEGKNKLEMEAAALIQASPMKYGTYTVPKSIFEKPPITSDIVEYL